MARLVDGLAHFFGRVELIARGADSSRRLAEEALSRGRPLEARDHALDILSRVPGSPLGLALWADAAEEAWLDHEVVTALSELSRAVPWRADVWLRLARAGRRIEWPEARDALERAASALEERDSARKALLELCDLDLRAGDAERALRWLDRIAAPISGLDRDVMLRRAECALARGDLEEAAHAASGMSPELDPEGRTALVHARLASAEGQSALAVDHALRAFVLDAPGASELLAALLAGSHDVVLVDRIRRVISASDVMAEPAWEAAFAFAEGRRDDARRALARGLSAGDRSAAVALLALAAETRDRDALHVLAARDDGLLSPDLRALHEASVTMAQGDDAAALDRLDAVRGDAAAWADDLRRSVFQGFMQTDAEGQIRWPRVLSELSRSARWLDRLDRLSAIEALAIERQRPLRVAVVGEFNAGKSTFLNALLGVDVAPTGVLPTTATLHWVAWAEDAFARIVVRGAEDRVVPHEGLKAALRSLNDAGASVDRVFIYAPIERLKRVEILDTPGFNAPDPEHLRAAKSAFEEAHAAIWLLDASGPLKESERRVLTDVRELGVPLQILVNKADRVAAEDMPKVLAHIEEGLANAGLSSIAPPLPMSARLALRGRLGDEEALAASGWAEVEHLVATRIVDASASLRERGLLRKAKKLATLLAEEVAARALEEAVALRKEREKREADRAAAARLSREASSLASNIDRDLEPARKRLAADLRPVSQAPSGERRDDPGLRAYVVERVIARFAEPLAASIGAAGGVSVSPRAGQAVRAVVTGAASAMDSPADLLTRPLDRVIVYAIDAFASALVADADAPSHAGPAAAFEKRANALRDALTAGPSA